MRTDTDTHRRIDKLTCTRTQTVSTPRRALPKLQMPEARMMMPLRKQRSTAKSGPPSPEYSWVMMAMMAVGPMVMSLQLPRSVYTKQPMNAEYRPYCEQGARGGYYYWVTRTRECAWVRPRED